MNSQALLSVLTTRGHKPEKKGGGKRSNQMKETLLRRKRQEKLEKSENLN